jgi:cell wall-associated NlpC family hydrolase
MQAVRLRRDHPAPSRRIAHALLIAAFGFATWAVLSASPTAGPAPTAVPPAFLGVPASPALDWRPLRTPLRTTSPSMAVEQAASVPDPMPVTTSSGGGGGGVLSMALRSLGARYVWGGASPAGFDCSGFVWYVHREIGRPVSRALEGQLSGGPPIPKDELQSGDTVFFANTYKRGLSHGGIYIGGGRFIHASDEISGVMISSLSEAYWAARYVGASRLW